MAKPKDFDLTFGKIPTTETGMKQPRYKVMGTVSEIGYEFLTKDPGLTAAYAAAKEALQETQKCLLADKAANMVADALERLG